MRFDEAIPADARRLRILSLLGLAILLIFLAIALMSEPFKYKSGLTRPVGAVVIMLFMATGVAFAALKCAIAIEQAQRRAILLISCFALSLRALGILTTPIMEIDYYRYLWDGKVLATGVSPYRYSPSDVLEKRVIEDRQYEDRDQHDQATPVTRSLRSRHPLPRGFSDSPPCHPG